jgi:hypothetical protein
MRNIYLEIAMIAMSCNSWHSYLEIALSCHSYIYASSVENPVKNGFAYAFRTNLRLSPLNRCLFLKCQGTLTFSQMSVNTYVMAVYASPR